MTDTNEGEVAAEEMGEGEQVVQMESNSVGSFDGWRFYLRTFPVWYRTKCEDNASPTDVGAPMKWSEYGTEGSVTYHQTMSKMTVSYKLVGSEAAYTETDLTVMMSSWELKVIIGEAEGKKSNLKTINGLSGELFKDIRPALSSWSIIEYEDGKYIEISLAKKLHMGWKMVFENTNFSIHKKSTFGWTATQPNAADIKLTQGECDKLQTIAPGQRQELQNAFVLGIPPEELCTGVEMKEDVEHIIIEVFMDEQVCARAEGRVPVEDFFAADVEAESIEIKMKGDELPVCWAVFSGLVSPQLSTWEIKKVQRKIKNDSGDHARFSTALRIILTKAQPGLWGTLYTDMQSPEFGQYKDPIDWANVCKASLALSPANPNCTQAKTERALKLCTAVTTKEDVILNKAYVTFHLWDKLEEYLYRFFKDSVEKFFAIKVKEQLLELCVVADGEYTVCEGALGGPCEPDRVTWSFDHEKSEGEENPHPVIKVMITKAASARGTKWGSAVFTKLEPWQVSAVMTGQELPKALPEELSLTEGRDGE
mmetsp:Transcript_68578/g.146743  ORF Transcript_68578/g.146743 Transcript_68578/m.146743 type:complete len:537 (-) Transcript_68578:135-1745(-)